MDPRQQKILEAIIEAFIRNALPVGSKHLTENYNFRLSSATIRNEMAQLEKEGYIVQPHTSAGRIPTNLAYRMLVDQMKEEEKMLKKAARDMMEAQKRYRLGKAKERLYETVSILSEVTQDLSFATVPEERGLFYIGISNMLRKPEFMGHPERATQVVQILENELSSVLATLKVSAEGAIYIGEENILPEFQSCSLLALPYSYQGFSGVIGLLGPTRMNYPYNMAALKSSLQMLLSQS